MNIVKKNEFSRLLHENRLKASEKKRKPLGINEPLARIKYIIYE